MVCTKDGVVVLNKPKGWTSHDAVNKMRRFAGTKKVGHLGTLDPMATGVLPLVVGRATRLAQFYTKSTKGYRARILFGFPTNTYDADGEATAERVDPVFSREELEGWLDEFRGTFQQIPPVVSAKKIGGVPAYKLARKNIEVEMAPVEVTLTRLELVAFELPEITLDVECSAGTYIRSLAHDLGQKAQCGAHLIDLVRTRSGDFLLENSRTMDEIKTLSEEDRFSEAVLPAAHLLPEFPGQNVDEITATQIRQGRDFRISPFANCSARYVKAIDRDGVLVAIGEIRVPNLYHPILVF